MDELVQILVPIGICVVLPIAIVLIIYLASINKENKRAEVLIKAIEANNNIDADKLAEALRKPKKSAREILNNRLLIGCVSSALGIALLIFNLFSPHGIKDVILLAAVVCLAIGIGFLTVYLITRKSVDK